MSISILILAFSWAGQIKAQTDTSNSRSYTEVNTSTNSKIEYKIQIASNADKLNKDSILIGSIKPKETIDEFKFKGQYKYIISSFDKYNEAKKFTSELKAKSGTSDIFIIAFENNNLVTDKNKLDNKNIKSINSEGVLIDKETTESHKFDFIEEATDFVREEKQIIKKIVDFYTKLYDELKHEPFAPVLLGLIIYFFLNLTILLIVMVVNRVSKDLLEKKSKRLKDKYQTFILDYVFVEEKETPIPAELMKIRSKFKRKVLMEEILHYEANFKGQADVKLRELYLKLGLYKNSLSKVRNRAWFVKAKGFRELSSMQMNKFNSEIKKYLTHNNYILRNEAHLALIQLDKSKPFEFLNDFDEHLTIWEQINIFHLVNYHYLEAPEFKTWLHHRNKSVKAFAIKMIGVFEQMDAIPLLLSDLKESSPWIRGHIIDTIGIIGLPDVLTNLKEIYDSETRQNQLKIIKAMQNIPDDSSLEFYEKHLKEKSYEYRMELIKAMYSLGEKGKEKINEIIANKTYDIQKYVDHISDPNI